MLLLLGDVALYTQLVGTGRVLSAGLSVGNDSPLCKNGRLDRDSGWGGELSWFQRTMY